MNVRAKFKVDSVNCTMTTAPKKDASGQLIKSERGDYVYGQVEMRTVVMSPVYQGSDPDAENTKFWQATPSGKLELGCVNLAAAEKFELGKEYYIDFTPAS